MRDIVEGSALQRASQGTALFSESTWTTSGKNIAVHLALSHLCATQMEN